MEMDHGYILKTEKYLDFSSGIAVNCLGHSNKKLIKALDLKQINYGTHLIFLVLQSKKN